MTLIHTYTDLTLAILFLHFLFTDFTVLCHTVQSASNIFYMVVVCVYHILVLCQNDLKPPSLSALKCPSGRDGHETCLVLITNRKSRTGFGLVPN